MKKLGLKAVFLSMILSFSWVLSLPAQAEYRYQLTPSISVGEVYDDNIDLSRDNKKSDYITGATPGIDFHILSRKTSLRIKYAPTFVRYARESGNNTTRHSANLDLSRQLSRHWSLDLSDTFLRSEDPLEDVLDLAGVRTTRNIYKNNDATAGFRYQFGPENVLSFGYRHGLRENSQPDLDDWTTQEFFSHVDYWPDVKNGLSIHYAYTRGDFSRDDLSNAGEDYTGFTTGLSYHYRFSPHTRCDVRYEFTKRDFEIPLDRAGEGPDESYNAHNMTVGMEHAFSRHFTAALRGGYYLQKRETAGDEGGPLYEVSLNRTFRHGSLTFGGDGGWHESYIDDSRRGFIRYNGVRARLAYQFLKELRGHAEGAYQVNRDSLSMEWKTYRGSSGLQWSFMRWYALSLDYTYARRSGDDHTQDYTDNRVMLRLTFQRPYIWRD